MSPEAKFLIIISHSGEDKRAHVVPEGPLCVLVNVLGA